MAMQIHANYDHSGTDYAERVREKQAVWKEEKAKEAEKAAEGKNAGKLPGPQDEYISSEKSGKKPTGLYWVGQNENGNRKIFFDDPKADHANGKDDPFREDEDGKSGCDASCFGMPGHFTSFRKPSAANRFFWCFWNDKIKLYRKPHKMKNRHFQKGKYYVQ